MASTLDIATVPSLPPRLRDGVSAAHRIGIGRNLDPEQQHTHRLIMRDRLFFSQRAIADPIAHDADLIGAASFGLWSLADLRAAVEGDPQFAAVARGDLAVIRASLDATIRLALEANTNQADMAALPVAPLPPRQSTRSVPLPVPPAAPRTPRQPGTHPPDPPATTPPTTTSPREPAPATEAPAAAPLASAPLPPPPHPHAPSLSLALRPTPPTTQTTGHRRRAARPPTTTPPRPLPCA